MAWAETVLTIIGLVLVGGLAIVLVVFLVALLHGVWRDL